MAKRRVLLVDDEVTVLLTMKAVLEISGFDVDTAASAREGKSKIKLREYQMVITDMRMESDAAGREVIQAARTAPYHPAVALLTAYPEDDMEDLGADKILVKARHTAVLIRDIVKLLDSHSAKLARLSTAASSPEKVQTPTKAAPTKAAGTKAAGTAAAGTTAAGTTAASKPRPAAKKLPTKKTPIKKSAKKKR